MTTAHPRITAASKNLVKPAPKENPQPVVLYGWGLTTKDREQGAISLALIWVNEALTDQPPPPWPRYCLCRLRGPSISELPGDGLRLVAPVVPILRHV